MNGCVVECMCVCLVLRWRCFALFVVELGVLCCFVCVGVDVGFGVYFVLFVINLKWMCG